MITESSILCPDIPCSRRFFAAGAAKILLDDVQRQIHSRSEPSGRIYEGLGLNIAHGTNDLYLWILPGEPVKVFVMCGGLSAVEQAACATRRRQYTLTGWSSGLDEFSAAIR